MQQNGINRRVFPPAFKAKVALEALKEQKTHSELSSIYGVHITQIMKWKKRALEGLTQIFSEAFVKKQTEDESLKEELYRQIGKQKIEIDWLKKKIGLIEQEVSFRH
jgi:transposase-like protein